MTARILAASPPAVARAATLDHVPFFAQEDYQCGPAALAMALAADGAAVTPAELVAQVYLPARQGSLQPEMLATARRHGRLALVLPPRLEALLTEVAAGRPVIVLQNLALAAAPVWHYAVVVGYDLERATIRLHSGLNAGLDMELAVFERTWARGGHWAMVAAAPSSPPVTVPTDALVSAAAALERVDASAAQQSYEALVARDPAAFGAWFGLGNTRHAARDLSGAEIAFRRATELNPASADAWNNLALVRHARGTLDDARVAAERAVALGGPRAGRYRETLALIEQAARR